MSIQDMAAKGQRKLQNKGDTMRNRWYDSINKMQQNYQAVGFGPTVTQRYVTGIQNAEYHAPDPNKWQENWLRAMQE